MKNFIKHIDNFTNDVSDFNITRSRGVNIDSKTINKIVNDTPVTGGDFGKSLKDIVEFSVYTPSGTLVGWKTIIPNYEYFKQNIIYTDSDRNIQKKSVLELKSSYLKTANGNLVISPTTELASLGITQGNFKIRVSLKTDMVGSFENKYKLKIKQISSSRTEILAVLPTTLDTNATDGVALNFEFDNFIKKQLLVSSIFHESKKFLKSKTFVEELQTKEISRKTSDYDFYLKKTLNKFTTTEYSFLRELDGIYEGIKKEFYSRLLGDYDEVYTKPRFVSEYVDVVELSLDKTPKFQINDPTLSEIKLFFKYMLMQMFDESELDKSYNLRFDDYLNNEINFGNGVSVPFLKYSISQSKTKTNNLNAEILIKTIDPLPELINEDSSFYISNIRFSDDILQDIIINSIVEEQTTNTFKLRGPNKSTYNTESTSKKYSVFGEKNSLLDDNDDFETASDYYKTTNEDIVNLNIDYSDFKNFVRFSSAKVRLDNFLVKFTKISKLKHKIKEYDELIASINEKVNRGLTDKISGENSVSYIINNDKKDIETRLLKELQTLTPYEKYLYYEDTPNAWPRETSFTLNGFTEEVASANGVYILGASSKYDLNIVFINTEYKNWRINYNSLLSKWRLVDSSNPDSFYIYSNNSNLASGFEAQPTNHVGFDNQSSLFSRIYLESPFLKNKNKLPPELIPNNITDFKKLDSFRWFQAKSKEAELYDKYNDDSLKNNLPEFIVRCPDENKKFLDFLDMVGEHFDIILIYIESMSSSRDIRNSIDKGIPNNLVWFVMNSFGITLKGREKGGESEQLEIEKTTISTPDETDLVWRRILNNLPYILKATGTENSIRALLRCYGIPDYLMRVKEFGGIEYETEISNDNSFLIDSYDYRLNLNEEGQYLEFPFGGEFSKNTIEEVGSIEFRIGVKSLFFSEFGEFNELRVNDDFGKIGPNLGAKTTINEKISDDIVSVNEEPGFYIFDDFFRPVNWGENVVGIKLKKVREGVSLIYPRIQTSPNNEVDDKNMIMKIYQDRGKLLNQEYNERYLLCEIHASSLLNGREVKLIINEDEDSSFNNIIKKQFKFSGSEESNKFTLSEIDANKLTSIDERKIPILSTNEWDFGLFHDKNKFQSPFANFYFSFKNTDGSAIIDNNGSPFYFDSEMRYDILITNDHIDRNISIYIKRVMDTDVLISKKEEIFFSENSSKLFSFSDKLIFGSSNGKNFYGDVDRFRLYKNIIDESRFLSHINFNEGYDQENYEELEENLLLKLNFNYPIDLTGSQPATIKNQTISDKYNNFDINAFHFKKTKFPYDFTGVSRRNICNFPRYGSQAFNNNKIRIEETQKISELSPSRRSTKRASDRTTIDTNKLGVYFGTSDIINREIMRFFGNLDLAEFIGDPKNVDKDEYDKLNKLNHIFFKNDFGKIDIQRYLNVIKSYIDPSFFYNLQKLIPARANLIAGLVIEPHLLERHKTKPIKISTEVKIDKTENNLRKNQTQLVSNILDMNLYKYTKRKNLISFGNDREYFTSSKCEHLDLLNLNIKTKVKNEPIVNDENYGGSFVNNHIDDRIEEFFTIDGLWVNKNKTYVVEDFNKNLIRKARINTAKTSFRNILSEGLLIKGFTNEMSNANGVYKVSFVNSSGNTVFASESRLWWVFYSTEKKRWILASNLVKNGARDLALNRVTSFDNFIWIGGNTASDQTNSLPRFFSTGYSNSIESGNILGENRDYYSSVEYQIYYDTIIQVDAILNGWVKCELDGIYEGSYIEKKTDERDLEYEVGIPYNKHKFTKGTIKHIYLNGNFKGTFSNGWLGSEIGNSTQFNNSYLRVVGDFDTNQNIGCENPLKVSGFIEDIKDNSNTTTASVLNENTQDIFIDEKEFSTINLIETPNELTEKKSNKIKFRTDYTINNYGLQELANYERGSYKDEIKTELNQTYEYPDLYECNLKYSVSIDARYIRNAIYIGSRVGTILNKTETDVKLNNVDLKIFYEYIKGKLVHKEIKVLTSSNIFTDQQIYNNDTRVETTLTAYDWIEDALTGNTYTFIKSIQAIINELKDNNRKFILLIYGPTESEKLFICNLDVVQKFKHSFNSRNFLDRANLVETKNETLFESTKLIENNKNNFIVDFEIEYSGEGYIGDEIVTIGTNKEKPSNFIGSWPINFSVNELFDIENTKIKGTTENIGDTLKSRWLNETNSTYTKVPSVIISKPQTANGNIARVSCICKTPTPNIKVNSKILKTGDLEIGNTIGNPNLDAADSSYFLIKSNLEYNVGVIQSKQFKIKINNSTNFGTEITNVVMLTPTTLNDFEINLPQNNSVDNTICRKNTNDSCIPSSYDTYEFNIVPMTVADKNLSVADEVTYFENNAPSTNFFTILNENKFLKYKKNLNNKQFVNNLTKDFNNRIASSYIQISGFYGSVKSANGIYNLKNFKYKNKEKTTNMFGYINENNAWYLEYTQDTWIIKNIDNTNYIIASKINNGYIFRANVENNIGFYTGNEIVNIGKQKVDADGFVYDNNNNKIGTKLQFATLEIKNSLRVVLNKLFFDENLDRFSSLLMWKIKITSRMNSDNIYEIPIIYFNPSSVEDSSLSLYNDINKKTNELLLIRTSSNEDCVLTTNQNEAWKIKAQDIMSGSVSPYEKINTYGEVILSAGATNDNSLGVTGDYHLNIENNLVNKNNWVVKYDTNLENYYLENEDSTIRFNKVKTYPRTGSYRTQTKNMNGTLEYIKNNENAIEILCEGFEYEYESANGEYKKIVDFSQNEIFRNKLGWSIIFRGGYWTIVNDVTNPTLLITEYKTHKQTGLFENKEALNGFVYVNSQILFTLKNVEKFKNLDVNTAILKSTETNLVLYRMQSNGSYVRRVGVELPIISNSFIKTLYKIHSSSKFELNYDSKKIFSENYSKQEITCISNVSITSEQNDSINLIVKDDKTKTNYEKTFNLNLNKNFENLVLNPTGKYEIENLNDSIQTPNGTNISVNCSVEVNKNKRVMQKIKQVQSFLINDKFSQILNSIEQQRFGKSKSFDTGQTINFTVNRKFTPFDINQIGNTENKKILNGKSVFHLNNKTRLGITSSKNTNNTTINSAGYLDNTPVIVRTPLPRDPSSFTDSFWFNSNEKIKDKTSEQIATTNVSKNPKFEMSFDSFVDINSLSFEVLNFENDLTSANGTYTSIGKKFNDFNVYKNNDWLFYKDIECWILINADVYGLDNLENYSYTTSSSQRFPSKLDGSKGSSANFLNQCGNINLIENG